MGVPIVAIVRAGISGAGITARYNRIVDSLKRNRKAKARLNRIKKRIVNNCDATLLLP